MIMNISKICQVNRTCYGTLKRFVIVASVWGWRRLEREPRARRALRWVQSLIKTTEACEIIIKVRQNENTLCNGWLLQNSRRFKTIFTNWSFVWFPVSEVSKQIIIIREQLASFTEHLASFMEHLASFMEHLTCSVSKSTIRKRLLL